MGAGSVWASISERLTCAAWAAAAFCITLFGNGEHDLITLAFSKHCNWPFILVGLVCWAINSLLFLYVFVWMRGVKGVARPLDQMPWLMNLGAASFAAAFVSFSIGVFPVYSFLAPVIIVCVTYGAIMSFHCIPTFGLLRPCGPLGGQFDGKED